MEKDDNRQLRNRSAKSKNVGVGRNSPSKEIPPTGFKGLSTNPLIRPDQRSLRSPTTPCCPSLVAALRSRSSRLQAHIRAALSAGSLAPALRYFLRPRPPLFGIAPLPSPTSQPKRHHKSYHQGRTEHSGRLIADNSTAQLAIRSRRTSAMRPRAIIWRRCPAFAPLKVLLAPFAPCAPLLDPGHRRQGPGL